VTPPCLSVSPSVMVCATGEEAPMPTNAITMPSDLSAANRQPREAWVAPIHSELAGSRSAGLHLGRAHTLPLVGAVIALYLVGKNSELLCLNVRVELDNQGALPVSIAPPFTGGPILLAGWRAEHGAQLCLALADK